jgi:hypothetical protein
VPELNTPLPLVAAAMGLVQQELQVPVVVILYLAQSPQRVGVVVDRRLIQLTALERQAVLVEVVHLAPVAELLVGQEIRLPQVLRRAAMAALVIQTHQLFLTASLEEEAVLQQWVNRRHLREAGMEGTEQHQPFLALL